MTTSLVALVTMISGAKKETTPSSVALATISSLEVLAMTRSQTFSAQTPSTDTMAMT